MKGEESETGRELSVTTKGNSPDNTDQKQDTRFQPGRSGNPAGRPKGARNKHSENFINAFAQDFEQHGAAVIERVRKDRPQDYLKVAAALLPKQMETETNRTRPVSELSDAELMDLLLDGIEVVVEAILVSRGHVPSRPNVSRCNNGSKRLVQRAWLLAKRP